MDLDRPQNGQDTISQNEQSQVIENSEGQFSTEEIQSNNNVQSENPPDNPPQSNQNEMNNQNFSEPSNISPDSPSQSIVQDNSIPSSANDAEITEGSAITNNITSNITVPPQQDDFLSPTIEIHFPENVNSPPPITDVSNSPENLENQNGNDQQNLPENAEIHPQDNSLDPGNNSNSIQENPTNIQTQETSTEIDPTNISVQETEKVELVDSNTPIQNENPESTSNQNEISELEITQSSNENENDIQTVSIDNNNSNIEHQNGETTNPENDENNISHVTDNSNEENECSLNNSNSIETPHEENVETSTEEAVVIPHQETVETTSEEQGEKQHEEKDQTSNEEKAETTSEEKVETSNEEKTETSNQEQGEAPYEKQGETTSEEKDQNSNEEKTETTSEEKTEPSNETTKSEGNHEETNTTKPSMNQNFNFKFTEKKKDDKNPKQDENKYQLDDLLNEEDFTMEEVIWHEDTSSKFKSNKDKHLNEYLQNNIEKVFELYRDTKNRKLIWKIYDLVNSRNPLLVNEIPKHQELFDIFAEIINFRNRIVEIKQEMDSTDCSTKKTLSQDEISLEDSVQHDNSDIQKVENELNSENQNETTNQIENKDDQLNADNLNKEVENNESLQSKENTENDQTTEKKNESDSQIKDEVNENQQQGESNQSTENTQQHDVDSTQMTENIQQSQNEEHPPETPSQTHETNEAVLVQESENVQNEQSNETAIETSQPENINSNVQLEQSNNNDVLNETIHNGQPTLQSTPMEHEQQIVPQETEAGQTHEDIKSAQVEQGEVPQEQQATTVEQSQEPKVETTDEQHKELTEPPATSEPPQDNVTQQINEHQESTQQAASEQQQESAQPQQTSEQQQESAQPQQTSEQQESAQPAVNEQQQESSQPEQTTEQPQDSTQIQQTTEQQETPHPTSEQQQESAQNQQTSEQQETTQPASEQQSESAQIQQTTEKQEAVVQPQQTEGEQHPDSAQQTNEQQPPQTESTVVQQVETTPEVVQKPPRPKFISQEPESITPLEEENLNYYRIGLLFEILSSAICKYPDLAYTSIYNCKSFCLSLLESFDISSVYNFTIKLAQTQTTKYHSFVWGFFKSIIKDCAIDLLLDVSHQQNEEQQKEVKKDIKRSSKKDSINISADSLLKKSNPIPTEWIYADYESVTCCSNSPSVHPELDLNDDPSDILYFGDDFYIDHNLVKHQQKYNMFINKVKRCHQIRLHLIDFLRIFITCYQQEKEFISTFLQILPEIFRILQYPTTPPDPSVKPRSVPDSPSASVPSSPSGSPKATTPPAPIPEHTEDNLFEQSQLKLTPMTAKTIDNINNPNSFYNFFYNRNFGEYAKTISKYNDEILESLINLGLYIKPQQCVVNAVIDVLKRPKDNGSTLLLKALNYSTKYFDKNMTEIIIPTIFRILTVMATSLKPKAKTTKSMLILPQLSPTTLYQAETIRQSSLLVPNEEEENSREDNEEEEEDRFEIEYVDDPLLVNSIMQNQNETEVKNESQEVDVVEDQKIEPTNQNEIQLVDAEMTPNQIDNQQETTNQNEPSNEDHLNEQISQETTQNEPITTQNGQEQLNETHQEMEQQVSNTIQPTDNEHLQEDNSLPQQTTTEIQQETNQQTSTEVPQETNQQASTAVQQETNQQASTAVQQETNQQPSTELQQETNQQTSVELQQETNQQSQVSTEVPQASTSIQQEINELNQLSTETTNEINQPSTDIQQEPNHQTETSQETIEQNHESSEIQPTLNEQNQVLNELEKFHETIDHNQTEERSINIEIHDDPINSQNSQSIEQEENQSTNETVNQVPTPSQPNKERHLTFDFNLHLNNIQQDQSIIDNEADEIPIDDSIEIENSIEGYPISKSYNHQHRHHPFSQSYTAGCNYGSTNDYHSNPITGYSNSYETTIPEIVAPIELPDDHIVFDLPPSLNHSTTDEDRFASDEETSSHDSSSFRLNLSSLGPTSKTTLSQVKFNLGNSTKSTSYLPRIDCKEPLSARNEPSAPIPIPSSPNLLEKKQLEKKKHEEAVSSLAVLNGKGGLKAMTIIPNNFILEQLVALIKKVMECVEVRHFFARCVQYIVAYSWNLGGRSKSLIVRTFLLEIGRIVGSIPFFNGWIAFQTKILRRYTRKLQGPPPNATSSSTPSSLASPNPVLSSAINNSSISPIGALAAQLASQYSNNERTFEFELDDFDESVIRTMIRSTNTSVYSYGNKNIKDKGKPVPKGRNCSMIPSELSKIISLTDDNGNPTTSLSMTALSEGSTVDNTETSEETTFESEQNEESQSDKSGKEKKDKTPKSAKDKKKEKERKEKERKERERKEKERKERERKEKERKERERKEKKERERKEKERREKEKKLKKHRTSTFTNPHAQPIKGLINSEDNSEDLSNSNSPTTEINYSACNDGVSKLTMLTQLALVRNRSVPVFRRQIFFTSQEKRQKDNEEEVDIDSHHEMDIPNGKYYSGSLPCTITENIEDESDSNNEASYSYSLNSDAISRSPNHDTRDRSLTTVTLNSKPKHTRKASDGLLNTGPKPLMNELLESDLNVLQKRRGRSSLEPNLGNKGKSKNGKPKSVGDKCTIF